MKTILEFLSENFQFLVVKFSVYLNRRVFVMHFRLLLHVDFSYFSYFNMFKDQRQGQARHGGHYFDSNKKEVRVFEARL